MSGVYIKSFSVQHTLTYNLIRHARNRNCHNFQTTNISFPKGFLRNSPMSDEAVITMTRQVGPTIYIIAGIITGQRCKHQLNNNIIWCKNVRPVLTLDVYCQLDSLVGSQNIT